MPYNPVTGQATRKEPDSSKITVFEYTASSCEERILQDVQETRHYCSSPSTSWINIDGIRRNDVTAICEYYAIDNLIKEDILSVGQRAKTDEIGDIVSCLLPMLYFNKAFCTVEQEQVNLILGKNFVLSFQEDPTRDEFGPVRERLRTTGSKLRSGGADGLFYALLDIIVDNYFIVMEKLGEHIEDLEDVVPRQPNTKTLARINMMRKEVTTLRRAISPVRELVNDLLKSESPLIQKKTGKYFKDVYDHIVQANDTVESYRDMVLNLQDLYLNNMNLKMNEVMKVLAVVTTLMAPMTVIAGIYGMNFDNMPELHTRYGYFITLGVMAVIFCIMIYVFKKRKWF